MKRFILIFIFMILVIPFSYAGEKVVNVDTSDLSAGDQFQISLKADNPQAKEIYGYQYTVSVDDSKVKAISQEATDFLSQDGAGTSVPANSISDDKAEYGEHRNTVSNGITVTGDLALVTFEMAQACSSVNLNLSFKFSDPVPAPIPSVDMLAEMLDITPPGNVTGFTGQSGNGQISLSWTNPLESDFAGVKILRKTTGYPSSPTDGTVVYNFTGTSYADTGLTNGTTYYYKAFSYDEVPNFSSGTTASGVPSIPQPAVYDYLTDCTEAEWGCGWFNTNNVLATDSQYARANSGGWAYITLDMGETRSSGTITVRCYSIFGEGPYYAGEATAYGSTNGSTWSSLGTFHVPEDGSPTDYQVLFNQDVRCVKVKLGIAECSVDWYVDSITW